MQSCELFVALWNDDIGMNQSQQKAGNTDLKNRPKDSPVVHGLSGSCTLIGSARYEPGNRTIRGLSDTSIPAITNEFMSVSDSPIGLRVPDYRSEPNTPAFQLPVYSVSFVGL